MSDEEEKMMTFDATEDKAEGDPENAENMDAMAFEEGNNDLVDDENETEFTVTNPQNNNGHIVYECRGVDDKGTWTGMRRFNEFFMLREKLEQNWPGVPIP
jgi:hypothetical protein